MKVSTGNFLGENLYRYRKKCNAANTGAVFCAFSFLAKNVTALAVICLVRHFSHANAPLRTLQLYGMH